MSEIRNKKLIEVSMPLEAINAASVREKSIRSGHPFPLHLWWSRKPLATARAVLFAQLVDDPSSREDLFPTPELQDEERDRLHAIIANLVRWDRRNDEKLWEVARREILKSNPDGVPQVLDPFAGGGSIPLEAQRLGIPAASSDLNPVAVIIQRALLQLPHLFKDQKPVHDEASSRIGGWEGAQGLAEDIRRYGEDFRNAAMRKLKGLYPEIVLSDGTAAEPIAWKWARTVRNPNPANPIEVPLVNSWWLSKKKGKEAWVEPVINGETITYRVRRDKDGPRGKEDGTVGRSGGVSIADGTAIDLDYIRKEAQAGRMGYHLLAAVIKSPTGRGREYVQVDSTHAEAIELCRSSEAPRGEIPEKGLGINLHAYGFYEWTDLFLPRQLQVMIQMSALVTSARENVYHDAIAAGLPEGKSLKDGGSGAKAYADAIAIYLSLGISRTTDLGNSLATWSSSRDQTRNMFSKQAIQMAWDFVEIYPFANASGDVGTALRTIANAVEQLPSAKSAHVACSDAASINYEDFVVSTDPPYYDYVGYADLSDFFYVWLRRSLSSLDLPEFSTLQTPKQDELVMNPHRWGGESKAEAFFTDGFQKVFRKMRSAARDDIPITVYYAYKQKDSSGKNASSAGWYTILSAIISAGWEITATWPMRSEREGRTREIGSNALASSIVLACRPRPLSAKSTTRRVFVASLRAELPDALRKLMRGSIAPVDLAQAAIGPGIAVFSRYTRVREADGSDMTVRDALVLINSILDELLGEQESEFDAETRFAMRWYRQYGWANSSSGIADQLARSSDTSIDALERGGIFEARGGRARLLAPTELEFGWDIAENNYISVWEATVRLAAVLNKEGVEKVSVLLSQLQHLLDVDAVKELGFLLHHEAQKRNDSQDATLFNGLVTAWEDVTDHARRTGPLAGASQLVLEL